ncbi:hypothetical protein [Microseira wollei]|uniref:hypothetical protein n=1 Tax=Microseira wollei TaxID=467598 RepID=UPI001CFE2FF6|nr:hypothetical protein [Microseira wollei]
MSIGEGGHSSAPLAAVVFYQDANRYKVTDRTGSIYHKKNYALVAAIAAKTRGASWKSSV